MTLALTASVAWGCSDFLGGLTARKLPALVVVFGSQVIALTVFAVLMAATADSPRSDDFWLLAAVSGLCEAVALAAFYKGLALGAMGVVAPIAACSALVPVVWGLATGEDPSSLQLVGAALAIGGALFVCREPSADRAGSRVATGAGLAAIAALGFGLFFVAIGAASDRAGPVWAVFVNRSVLVALLAAAVIVAGPGMPSLSPRLAVLALIGFLDVGASTVYATATQHGLLSVVGLLGSLYPVITVILAVVFLRERLTPLRSIAAAVVLAGVLMVAGG